MQAGECIDCGVAVQPPYYRCDSCVRAIMREHLYYVQRGARTKVTCKIVDPNVLLLTEADKQFLTEMKVSAA